MAGLVVSRDSRGAKRTQVKAEGPLLELGNGIITRLDFNGRRTPTFTLLSFRRDELIDILLAGLTSQITAVRGVVDDPSTLVDAFTFDGDSPLSALTEFAELEDLEIGIRRDGGLQFLIDLVDRAGDFVSYGEIPMTITDGVLLGESSPTTNFGGGLIYSVQQGPGGTDTVNVIKFDLRWLQGLGLEIVDAKIQFTTNGTGNSTTHVIQLIPLRRSAGGVLREIAELQSTWNNHLTGSAWSSGGARATNDDRDNANEWETTIDGTGAGNVAEFTGDNLAATLTLAEYLQTIIDGTDGFFKDGLARFVLDASPSGQSSLFTQFHSDDAVVKANRPQLLITLAKDSPRFLFQKNVVGISKELDTREQANVVYPFGQGGADSGVRATIGNARWTVATVPSGTTFTIIETAIFEDSHLVGNFVDDLSGTRPIPAVFEITATAEATQEVTTSGAHGLAPGDPFTFRENAAGDELIFVESPASQALFNQITKTLIADDIPSIDNLVENPAFRDFTDIGGGEFLADAWNKVGVSPVVTEETDPTLTSVGGSAQRVAFVTSGDGLESDAIPVAPVAPDIFFVGFIQFTLLSGAIEFFLEHSTEGRFPEEGAKVQAISNKLDAPQQLTIAGKEYPAGTIKLVIRSTETPTTFILDAAQLTNAGFEAPFFEGRAPVKLWQRGLDELFLNKDPQISHAIPNALDLTGARPEDFPYDQVLLGAEVLIDDFELEIDDIRSRVLDLTEELLTSGTLSMRLSTTKDDLIDQLSKLDRRRRRIVPPNVGLPQIQKVEFDVDDAGELTINFTAGNNCLSFRFLIADPGDPTPTYGEVVSGGTPSNLILGEKTVTGVIIAAGEAREARVVAFGLIDGLGQQGESEARTISQPPPIGSTFRARVFRSTDLSVPTASVSVKEEWNDEDIDVGNLHSPTPPNNERLRMNVPTGRWLQILQGSWDGAGAPAGTRSITILRAGGGTPVTNPLVDRGRPGGALVHQSFGFEIAPLAGGYFRSTIFQDSGSTELILAIESFFASIRIPIAENQPRVHVSGSGTKSIPSATDTVIDWVGTNEEKGGTWFSGGAPSRITVPTGADGPLLLMAHGFLNTIAGGNVDGLHSARIKKNGTTIIGRADIPNQGSIGGINSVLQPVAILDMAAVATDFYEHELRQVFTATNTINQAVSDLYALRLLGTTNPRAEVSKTGVQLIATATPTAVAWDTQDVDVGNLIDLGTDATLVTSSFTGMMLLIAQVRWASTASAGKRDIFFRLNGDDLNIDPPWLARETSPGSGELVYQIMAWIDVVLGDEIQLFAEQVTGAGLNIQVADTKLQVIRIADS